MFLKKQNKPTGRKILHKVKGKWVAAMVVAGTVGGILLVNDTVQATVNTAATQVMQSVASANFSAKSDLLEDDQIQSESLQALGAIEGAWEKNTVDEVRAEIARQREAGLDAYVVQWGDTLSVLAEATGKSVEELATSNQIGNWHLILTGDILQNILSDVAPVAAATPASESAAESESTVVEETVSETSESVEESESIVEESSESVEDPESIVEESSESVEEPESIVEESSESIVEESSESVEEPESIVEESSESVEEPESVVEESESQVIEEIDESQSVVESSSEELAEEASSESAESSSAVVENITKQESIAHEVIYQDNDQLAQGENKVIQNGVDGLKEVVYDGTTNEVIKETVLEEPVNEIVEVGTMTSETVTETVQEEIPFETERVENPDAVSGNETVIQEGQSGTKELSYEVVYENGVEVSRELLSETIISAPVNRIVEVGTAAPVVEPVTETVEETEQKEIPFDTIYRDNANLTTGTETVVQEGQTGTKEVTYEVTYQDGVETNRTVVEEAVITEPVDRIIERGTIVVTTETDTVTEVIPFETIRQDNPELPVGTEQVIQEGQDGSTVTTYNVTYENGVEVSREQVGEPTVTQAINEIIEVGTKAKEVVEDTPTGGTVEDVKYGVESGDTLYSIAANFGTTAAAIAEATGISVDSSIWVGQTLIIPSATLEQMDNEQANDGQAIVMLDAGHGGTDGGASANGASEEDMNLNLANQLTAELANRGYEVLNTREGDTTVSLSDRSAEANASDADIFISLHHNALNGSAEGIETFYYEYTVGYEPSQNEAEHNDGQRIANSAYLAELIQAELIASTEAVDRGVKTDTFAVLRETDVPSVLVEFGFIDNTSEQAQLLNAEYQQIMIDAVANAVDTYFATVGY